MSKGEVAAYLGGGATGGLGVAGLATGGVAMGWGAAACAGGVGIAVGGAVLGAVSLVEAFTHKRTCEIEVTVPRGTTWREVDRSIDSGNAPGFGINGNVLTFVFGNNGSFSSALRLRSNDGRYLVVAASNPAVGCNKTRAYCGSNSSRTPERVRDDMDNWGECERGVCKGRKRDVYDNPSSFSYEVC